jgi:aminopeptidase N
MIRLVMVTALLFLPLAALAAAETPVHDLSIDFAVEKHMLRGTSTITLPAGGTYVVDMTGLVISALTKNGAPLDIPKDPQALSLQPRETEVISITYEVVFPGNGRTPVDGAPAGTVGPDGIELDDGWYPSITGPAVFNLIARVPAEWEAVSEAEGVSVKTVGEGRREFSFSYGHPVAGIHFAAAEYVAERDLFHGVELNSYFLPDDAWKAGAYREQAMTYLDMYERSIGLFPFKRYSIVEGVTAGGRSVPTATFLGRKTVELPFVEETELGRGMVRQWLGCLVSSPAVGDWTEGLTSYLADQRFEEMKGKGPDFRKQAMIFFQSAVVEENDVPLKSFNARADSVGRAVGRGKGAMVFHMLKRLVGDDVFHGALTALIDLYRFKEASWTDIRDVFERASGKDLHRFFADWVERVGEPELALDGVRADYRGSKAVVSYDLVRRGGDYALSVPVTLRTKTGEVRKIVEVDKDVSSLTIEADDRPVELVIDEDYDVFRKLSGAEYPPVIARLLGDAKRLFVMPDEGGETFSGLADVLKEQGFAVKKESEVVFDDLKTSSILIPAGGTTLPEKLFGKTERGGPTADFEVTVRADPFNRSGVVAVFDGKALSDAADYVERLAGYGQYSRVAFTAGRNPVKTVIESDRGVEKRVEDEVWGIEMPRLSRINDIADRAGDKKIVYVGEVHNRFEQHRVQLDVIRELYKKNKKLAIGMEMFQKPFQEYLDKYIAGDIEEKELLKKTEYFERWGFDYQLYREILLFAREFRLPVVALNIRKEIVTKVSKQGLYSLTPEEMKEVPADMDFSDGAYRDRLKEVFAAHKTADGSDFDFFYQAQILWDESMAHNAADFLSRNPGYQMVVIAGAGHLMYGVGVPKRLYRLNKEDYTIVLSGDDVEKGISDVVLFPEPLDYTQAPKLMVELREEDGREKIVDFAPDSVSEKAGLKKDDVILELDGEKVANVGDVRLHLLYKKKGDEAEVKVLRKRFLLGETEMSFKVAL